MTSKAGHLLFGTHRISVVCLATLMLLLTAVGRLAAGQERTLLGFSGDDGEVPTGPVVFDQAGNLYGAATYGGASGKGTVYQLVPGVGGGWTENVLYTFLGGSDGANPVAGLVLDVAGNLYGTTSTGGTGCSGTGCGTIFELNHTGDFWTETVLYRFQGDTDGEDPLAGLIFDQLGHLYGTTAYGGECNQGNANGTIFQFSHTSSGWVRTTLHSFCGFLAGEGPTSLVLDRAGNLYGTAAGGSTGWGVVYKLIRRGAGAWSEAVLHTFTQQDGYAGATGLIFDSMGDLYGVGDTGGSNDAGTVWELMPAGAAGWHLKVLYNFQGSIDGNGPFAVPIFDRYGNLYGTTYNGGFDDSGTVWKLTPQGNGQWSETVVYRFPPFGSNPYNPLAGFVTDAAGNLYGTTPKGCAHTQLSCNGLGCGCVYEITP